MSSLNRPGGSNRPRGEHVMKRKILERVEGEGKPEKEIYINGKEADGLMIERLWEWEICKQITGETTLQRTETKYQQVFY